MSYLIPYFRPKNVLLRPKNVCLYLIYKKNSIKFIVPKNFVAVWNKSNLLVYEKRKNKKKQKILALAALF
jgi:hypothetical protein